MGVGGGGVTDVIDRSGVPLSSETWIFLAPNLKHLKNVRVKGSFVVPNIYIFCVANSRKQFCRHNIDFVVINLDKFMKFCSR